MKILIAEDDNATRKVLTELLQTLGHAVIGQAKSGEDLVRLALKLEPELIVTDFDMPELTGLEAAQEIYETLKIPIIIVTVYSDEALIEKCFNSNISTFLVKPISLNALRAAIAVAINRHRKVCELTEEVCCLKLAIENRKVIEKAKGMLMEKHGLTENEAHRSLQKIARSHSLKIVDVANRIVAVKDML